MIGKHHNLSNQSGQQSNGGKPKTNVTNNVAPTAQHACFTYCFFKDTSNNKKKGNGVDLTITRRKWNHCKNSTASWHAILLAAVKGAARQRFCAPFFWCLRRECWMKKNWWLNLELGTQSVCRTEAGWCMLVHRNPTTTKNKETWCQRLRFLPFCSGFRLFTLIFSRLPYLSK